LSGGNWLHELDTCSSTNSWALEHAATLKHGEVVFTRQQTAGRGQHGRVWYAPAGGLTASFVLTDLPVAQLPGLSLIAGLAVIYAIEDLLPELQGQLRLKWPNDVLIHERKLAGILPEATTSGDHARAVIGVGLNRAVDFAQSGLTANQVGNPISLHQIVNQAPSERACLTQIRFYLMQMRDLLSSADATIARFLPALQQRDLLQHRRVTLTLNGTQISGQAAGIDASGRLLLYLEDQHEDRNQSEVQAFSTGQVAKWGNAD
jgi:BirA family biotin operon repressor/biotin-[acetyl-CoA-carboxylase] ligase